MNRYDPAAQFTVGKPVRYFTSIEGTVYPVDASNDEASRTVLKAMQMYFRQKVGTAAGRDGRSQGRLAAFTDILRWVTKRHNDIGRAALADSGPAGHAKELIAITQRQEAITRSSFSSTQLADYRDGQIAAFKESVTFLGRFI